jgi:hypothetical protein
MAEGYSLRPSSDLYDSGPALWMFMPYYTAIRKKENLAGKVLDRELSVHYMRRDGALCEKQNKAKSFNAEMRSEMDKVVKKLEIKDPDKMWAEMEDACMAIYQKYTKGENR